MLERLACFTHAYQVCFQSMILAAFQFFNALFVNIKTDYAVFLAIFNGERQTYVSQADYRNLSVL